MASRACRSLVQFVRRLGQPMPARDFRDFCSTNTGSAGYGWPWGPSGPRVLTS